MHLDDCRPVVQTLIAIKCFETSILLDLDKYQFVYRVNRSAEDAISQQRFTRPWNTWRRCYVRMLYVDFNSTVVPL